MTNRQTLPLLWLLSDARNDVRLEETLRSLPHGSGFVFRHYHLHGAARRKRFDELTDVARKHGHLVILSRGRGWGEDGIYGPPETLGEGFRLATAHDGDEIARAVAAQADGIFLSPVYPTASHRDAETLGPMGFSVLAQQSPVPIIALGGMTYARARELQWPRWGAIDGLASTHAA